MNILKVKEKELEFIDIDGGGIPIYHYQRKPFTGIIVDYFFGTDIIAGETEYINGYQEGVVKVFYENGNIEYECYKKDNLLHGTYKDWDEKGNLISTTEWKDGVKIK